MWSILGNVPCILEKNVFFALIQWNVLYMSIMFLWSIVLFKYCLYVWCSIHYWKDDIALSHCYCTAVYLSFYIFSCSDYECIYNCWTWLSESEDFIAKIHMPVAMSFHLSSLFSAACRRSSYVKSFPVLG